MTGLTISEQEFMAVADQIVNFPNLKYLHIGDPYILDYDYRRENSNRTKLPGNLALLSKLEMVVFTGGNIDMDDAMAKLAPIKSLKGLSFRLMFKPLPKQLPDLSQIRMISLQGNALMDLDLRNVRWELVDLRSGGQEVLTRLSTVPSISSLNLHQVELGDGTVLKSFRNLKDLALFSIRSSNPPFMKQVSSLTTLTSLRLSSIRNQHLTGISALKKLKRLSLIYFNTLSTEPEQLAEVAALNKLEALTLVSNNMHVVPDVFANLNLLKSLTIKGNYRAGALPRSVFLLPLSDSLDISSNGLTEIPDLDRYPFKNIKILRMNDNKLSSVPQGLSDLTQLRVLDVSVNQLTTLPSDFGRMTELTDFNARNNQLVSLPASMGNCTKLVRVQLNQNNIAALPAGWKNTKMLQVLNLDDNVNIDAASVWNVVLETPRNRLITQLNHTGLKSLPATAKWKHVKFERLSMENNMISSLPPQFAQIGDFGLISLKGNPLPASLADSRITTPADLKVLYYQMKVPTDSLRVDDKVYAAVLMDRISSLYVKKKWAEVVDFVDQAKILDPNSTGNEWSLALIGVSRFKLKDYKGAIQDFDRFIEKDAASNHHSESISAMVELYKHESHLLLGEKEKAAQTTAYFAETHNDYESFYSFFDYYIEIGDQLRGQALLDKVLPAFRSEMIKNRRPDGQYNQGDICQYAEVLIMAGKSQAAINLLNSMEDDRYRGSYYSIKNCLVAMAACMLDPSSFPEIQSNLANLLHQKRKIIEGFWSFSTLIAWAELTKKSETLQANLKALQKTAGYSED